MNKFQEAEVVGRDLLKSFLDQIGAIDQVATEDSFNPVDYYYTYKGNKAVVEIKVRDKKYECYSTHIIEEKKLQALLKAKVDGECVVAGYVCFFGNTVYGYNTDDILKNTVVEYLYCNKTTANESERVEKTVRMIPIELSQRFERVEGKWRKV